MRVFYMIIAVVSLYFFITIASMPELGVARTLLSVGFIGVFLFVVVEFFRIPGRNTQDKFREELRRRTRGRR